MQKKSILAVTALVGLSGIAVLGSEVGLISRIVESIKESPIMQASVSQRTTGIGNTTLNDTESNVESGLNASTPTPSSDIDTSAIQTSPTSESNGLEIETPEHILWGVILRQSEKYEKLAEAARQSGKSDASWTDGFVRKTKLSPENAEIFKQKAIEYANEMLPVTERREEIGLHYKKARESGKRIPNDLALRKELSELQEKKKELALKFRDEFRKAIDEEAFKAFEEWLKTEFAKNFHTKRFSGKDIYKAKIKNGEISSTEKNIPGDHHK